MLVQTAAALSASLAAVPTTASVNQLVAFTLTLTNSGQAAANVSAVTVPAVAGATCTVPSPVPPRTVAGGASLAFTWSCTPTAAGSFTVSPTVTAADANSGANVSPAVTPVTVTVQATASLTATLTPSTTTVAITTPRTPVTLTLEILNTGTVAAHISSVTPTFSPGGSNGTCTAAVPASQDVAASSTAPFVWTCTPEKANTFTYGAAVVATPATVTVPSVTVTAI